MRKIFTNISDNNEIKIDTSTLASAFANAPAGGDPPEQGGNEDTKSASIISGHSHISIVTTYRQGIWQRIPTLLLAEGCDCPHGRGCDPGRCLRIISSSSLHQYRIGDE